MGAFDSYDSGSAFDNYDSALAPQPKSSNWLINFLANAASRVTKPTPTWEDSGATASQGAGRLLLNSVTGNFADPAIGYAKSYLSGTDPASTIAAERAKTKAARDALGWGAVPYDVAGYVLGPGRVLGAIGKGGGLLARTLGGAAQGGIAGGGYAFGGDVGDPNADMLNDVGSGAVGGAIFGGASAPIAGLLASGANALGRKLAPAIPSTSSLLNAKNAAFGKLDYTYDSSDASQLAKDVGASFRKKGMTQYSTPAEYWFNNDVQNALSGNDVTMQNLRDLKARADKELAPAYAETFKKHVDDLFENTDPVGASAKDAFADLKAANRANSLYKNSALLDQWERDANTAGGQSVPRAAGSYIRSGDAARYLSGPKDPRYQAVKDISDSEGSVADWMNSRSYGISHHVLAPLATTALSAGGIAAGHHFGWPLEYMVGTATMPAVATAASALSGSSAKPALDTARRVLTDTPAAWKMSDETRRVLQQLIMRGASSGWSQLGY